ncbi:MAG: hypothetical protein FVQ79_09620 [Planctomycetes bacterium]|nr:hypothetical protein [Planctomycetota bacterium]
MSQGSFNPILAAGDIVGGAVTFVGDFASNIGSGFASIFQPKPVIRTQIMEPMGSVNYWDSISGQAETLRNAQRARFIEEELVSGNVGSAALASAADRPTFWESAGDIFRELAPALYNRYLADDVSRYLGPEPPPPLPSPAPAPPAMAPSGVWPVFFGQQEKGQFRAGVAPKKAGVNTMVLAAGGLLILFLLRKK